MHFACVSGKICGHAGHMHLSIFFVEVLSLGLGSSYRPFCFLLFAMICECVHLEVHALSSMLFFNVDQG